MALASKQALGASQRKSSAPDAKNVGAPAAAPSPKSNEPAYLRPLLLTLGFTSKGARYTKSIGLASIEVDFDKRRIRYPEDRGLVVNAAQTCHFEANENFVVLECVHRLLEKGYKPEHIELEPTWKLGHGASGGRADILVKDNHGKPLLIIECKTPGREFDGAWRATLRDGDQLFSYAQQISETQFLCLYTSSFHNGELSYTSRIIAHRDNPNYLADNPQFRGFKEACDVKHRYAIWRDTYKLDYTTKGIFEDNIQPYHIGKDKYSLADLDVIASVDQQKKYHEFATILRQHNVSGRENAFDKLVNLFLCKLVDEAINPHDLKFYWKGVAYDTHFDLLDRLQQLYQAGMKEFLGEDITYIDRGAVLNAMRFIRQNPDATQNAVWKLFQQQKFFTNNDFSFIDVHNERLFYQNADVLLKILQMWQDIRLTGDYQHNQFLGDLFEGFLDQGIKQSEGQYFTPGPICRFILSSLPLESMLAKTKQPPRAIDYACGAGHFLTELASQLRSLLPRDTSLSDYHKAIFGIEKEYRLSKVAKVSAFMYGQKDINVCYGDALVNQHAAFPDIRDGSFDLLVANPPYSVRGFLETLPEEERKAYALTATINDAETANSIETFFVERAKQLLRAGGVAGIILPASLLANGGSVYVRAREILIQHFDVVAIAEFGSGTFGKTGTNTVTLFLRRKRTTPETAEHYRERVAEWFKGCDNSKRKQVIYKDARLIDDYANHIGVSVADYKTLLQGRPNATLLAHATFEKYRKAFDESSEVASLKKAKGFKAKSKHEQDEELARRFLAFTQSIERDKLYHFVMAADQPNPVLLVRSPTETKALRKFLGYSWSDAKGNEGIQPIKDGKGNLVSTLYDETDRSNANKINRLISQNFDGKLASIPSALGECAAMARLIDLLDFSRAEFDKTVSLSARGPGQSSAVLSTRWPMTRLSDIASIQNGGTPDTGNAKFWEKGNICWATLVDTKNKYLSDTQRKITHAGLKFTTLLPPGTVIFSSRATIGEVCINTVPTATNQGYKSFICDDAKIRNLYLYHLLVSLRTTLENLVPAGSKYKEINTTAIGDFQIPLPTLAVQDHVVAECEAVDKEVEKAQVALSKTEQAMAARVAAIYESKVPHQTVDSLALDVQYGLNEKMNEDGRGYRIFRMNEIVRGRMVDNGAMKYADISKEEFSKYKLHRGDLLFIRSNGSLEHIGKVGLFDLKGDYCYASYLVRVVPDTSKVSPPFLLHMLRAPSTRQAIMKLAVKSGGTNNVNATKMRGLKVPVPSLAIQNKFVADIDAMEQRIAEAEAIISTAAARKQAILEKYL